MVQDVQWNPLPNRTVRISWKEPEKINGVITNFTVAYTIDSTLPYKKWKHINVTGVKYSSIVSIQKNCFLNVLFLNVNYFILTLSYLIKMDSFKINYVNYFIV